MKETVPAYRRHDISDETWALLEPHLPGRRGVWGGIAEDNRLFINAVFWILRTGAPWRDLPPDYGGWSNTHRRFIRWRTERPPAKAGGFCAGRRGLKVHPLLRPAL